MNTRYLEEIWLENLAKSTSFPGIHNFGMNCYANSILQVFNHTPSFVNYFKNYPCDCRQVESGEINESSAEMNESDEDESDEDEDCYHCLLREHVEMFEYCQNTNKTIDPWDLLKALERSDPKEFKFGKAADASEFFDKISDKLEDSNKKSVISDIYSSKIATIYHCKFCGNEWRNVGTEQLLLYKNGQTENITDKLAEMSKEKDVHGPRTCEKCNVQRDATGKRVIDSPPRNLTIRMVDSQPGSAGKTHFPETINIRPYMEAQTGGEVTYELYAVVVSVSVVFSKYPHYFAFCRAPNGQWNCCNDTDVRKTSLEDVLNCDPYFMIYRRSPELDKRITPTERDDKEEIEPRISIRNFEISPKSFYGH